jgi:hypothetical protein
VSQQTWAALKEYLKRLTTTWQVSAAGVGGVPCGAVRHPDPRLCVGAVDRVSGSEGSSVVEKSGADGWFWVGDGVGLVPVAYGVTADLATQSVPTGWRA